MFTGDQLKMIAEFVDRRLGGLLMLHGPRAFAEGGWTGTAVADILPVVMDRTKVQAKGTVMRLSIKPPRAGAATAVTQLGATEQASAEPCRTGCYCLAANSSNSNSPADERTIT